MAIYQNIKRRRIELGLSQYDLADRLHKFTQSQVSKIEQGTRKLSAEDLIMIAKALEVPVTELIDRKL